MDVSGLWTALHNTGDGATQAVELALNGPDGQVWYANGILTFSPGTLDRLAPRPRPDRLGGKITWLSAQAMARLEQVGLFVKTQPFDVNQPISGELEFARGLRDVRVTERTSSGARSFSVTEFGGIYLGENDGVPEKWVYTFSFPGAPSRKVG